MGEAPLAARSPPLAEMHSDDTHRCHPRPENPNLGRAPGHKTESKKMDQRAKVLQAIHPLPGSQSPHPHPRDRRPHHGGATGDDRQYGQRRQVSGSSGRRGRQQVAGCSNRTRTTNQQPRKPQPRPGVGAPRSPRSKGSPPPFSPTLTRPKAKSKESRQRSPPSCSRSRGRRPPHQNHRRQAAVFRPYIFDMAALGGVPAKL